ncbi:carboxymuconolactone decarboxylase family protein [Methanobrevibacter cuticularis]|uniref:Carboxymuconolactone decarboxylase family protein n=1 Tax=Methanobrevibacter cuticularis TaxID=47311 RepID=A0A166E9S2_9EURY|nr:carboxymuconolactone decarboxylase family protein [Methanobrevibacter cuticularis]KZX16428.1 carboxymuconolactone decarboxylase family protein [Methanobrevibacter cuticularis]
MKENVFYGKGMKAVEDDYPDLHLAIVGLNEAVFTGKALDYKTQKLIALAITASNSDTRATKRQMESVIKEFGATKDEIMDTLRVVLLTSGMPPFIKAVHLLKKIIE